MKRPVALVLGGAKTVWRDLERAQTLTEGLDTIIVASNHAGIHYPGLIDAWATLHHERFADWRAERAGAGRATDYRAFIHAKHRDCPWAEVVPERWSGSSGLYAAQVALEMLRVCGVVLCGVPMDADAGHIARPGPWSDPEKFRPGFDAARRENAPIRSMSGWSADLLGRADGAWLSVVTGAFAPPRPAIVESVAMHIRFTADHDYTPTGDQRITIAYKAGMEETVRRECGDEAVRLGRAVEIAPPKRRKAKA